MATTKVFWILPSTVGFFLRYSSGVGLRGESGIDSGAGRNIWSEVCVASVERLSSDLVREFVVSTESELSRRSLSTSTEALDLGSGGYGWCCLGLWSLEFLSSQHS